MATKLGNSGSDASVDECQRSVEHAFLRLGYILAEIARNVDADQEIASKDGHAQTNLATDNDSENGGWL